MAADSVRRGRLFFADPAHRVDGTDTEFAKVDAAATDRVALRQAELAIATWYLTTRTPQ